MGMKSMATVEEIRRYYDEYGSISRVSRELKISRNTVRKILNRIQDVQNGFQKEILSENQNQPRHNRVITEELSDFVQKKLEDNKKKPKKQRLSAIDIHRLAQAGGHQVGYSSVKNIVNEWKESHITRDLYVLQDPPEGYRAEFDWGFVDLFINDSPRKISMAIFSLVFSQYRFGRLYPSQTTSDVIQGHVDFFHEIAAVPQTVVYDNATTIYDRRTGRYNPTFLSCAVHYGFEPKVCNCGSPQEKGSCEKSVSVVRRAAFSENLHFKSLEAANLHLAQCLVGLNQQKVFRRTKIPVQLLEDERPYLLTLPVMEFSNYELRQVSINGYGLIQFQKNFYSVPEQHCSKKIFLKIYADKIEMLDNDTVIANHTRLFGIFQYSLQIPHFIGVLERKPGSIPHSKLLRSQNKTIQDLFDIYYAQKPKDFLPVLRLFKEFSPEMVCVAVESCIKRDLPPTWEILRMFIVEPKPSEPESEDWKNLEFTIPEPDLKLFDKKLQEGKND